MSLLMFDENPLAYAIRGLFASNEQGAWYDPSDFSTLFQDSAGTTPVTAVGQPVGLALDKRLGLVLGSELIANGDFDNADGWVLQSEISISGGSLNFNATATRTATATGASCVSGRWYVVEFDLTFTSGIPRFDAGGGTTNITASTGHKKYIRQATGTNDFFFTCSSGGGVFSVDNLTIRELPGNHATQTTSTARPTLQQDSNGMYYLSFDGVDDYLSTGAIGPFNFLHDNTGATVHIGYSVSGTNIYHTILGTSNLGSAVTIGHTLSQDDRTTGAINNTVCNGSGTLFSNQQIITGVSSARRVVTARNAPASHIVRRNAVQIGSTSTETGTASTANSTYSLRIGVAPTGVFPLNGRIYGLIIRGAASSDGQIAAGEAWCNSKARAY